MGIVAVGRRAVSTRRKSPLKRISKRSPRIPKINISEAVFQEQVLQIASLYGWSWYHTYDSRRSNPGFPDLVLIRGGSRPRTIFLELKSTKGRLTEDQQFWLRHFLDMGWESYALWPDDFDLVNEILK